MTKGRAGISFFFLSSSINLHLNIQDILLHKFITLTMFLEEGLPLGAQVQEQNALSQVFTQIAGMELPCF